VPLVRLLALHRTLLFTQEIIVYIGAEAHVNGGSACSA
jgi:hypothetical protein